MSTFPSYAVETALSAFCLLASRSTRVTLFCAVNSLLKTVVLVFAIVAPVASFAQSDQPPRRADVCADFIRADQFDYGPEGLPNYPEIYEAAAAHIAATYGNAAYGGGSKGSWQTNQRRDVTASPYSPPVEVIGR